MQMARQDDDATAQAHPDAGRVRERSPQRRCIVTRAVKPKDQLLRFVLDPDGTVVPDLANVLPGRGLWLVPHREVLDKACARNAFARAAREKAIVPEDLAERVATLLAGRCVQLLAFARRAGKATAGFERVRDWLRSGRAGLLIEAADGAAGGRGKLRGLAGDLPIAAVLRASELGNAFGREHVVHAAVSPGGFAERLRSEFIRLAGFRQADEGREQA